MLMTNTCPSATRMPAAVSAAPETSPPQPRLLLLDDDPYMLGIQVRMLRDLGYAVVGTFASAPEALSYVMANPDSVDVIFCDVNMPGMDGVEFLQGLCHTPFCGNIILLSGASLRIMHTIQRLLAGARFAILGSLQKPASRAAVRALLDCWEPPAPERAPQPLAEIAPADLLVAVESRQWVLHYQPKVDLDSGRPIGVEALVRWQHPAHGLVYPDRFIGLAEDCGAVDALTDWVLETALRQLAAWRAQGFDLHIAINLSMDNLRVPGFAQRVGELAKAACLPPQYVTLEITESRLMSPSPVPLEGLLRLRMRGFGLSIDDFGTGHSSLVQLRDVPFTELKVDRGFVSGARHNQIIRPILEGSIGIAKRLGMQSVAEGVETEDDWQLMHEIGCDQAQGWFIARPMPAEQIVPWIEQRTSR